MGWKDYHLHEFEIAGQRYGVPNPVPLRSSAGQLW